MIHKPNFFFAMSPFDWPDYKKKLKLWRLPHYRKFYGKMECRPLWPNYIGVKGKTLGKTYGIITRCYSENIGNLGNILRTYWELIGNSKKHVENKGKNEKKTFHLDATWTTPSFNYNYPSIHVHTSHELTTSD
jgi:hypothetical protein